LITERPGPATFDSLDPATGEVVGSYPVHDTAAVYAAVARARPAAAFWSPLTFAERARRLTTWAGVLTRRIGQLAELVHAETGKPHSDAQLEIVLSVEHITWAAKHAGKVLGPRKTSPGLLMRNHTATVEYQPLGVIGVIGPWNYPVFTPIGSIAYALAAGNAVVYKPSDHTPGTGAWLADAFAQVVPEAPVLQLVTGFGATGDALCRAGVDKIAFTGSAATATKVMHACSSMPTPTSARPPTPRSGAACPTPGRPAPGSSGSTCTNGSTTCSSPRSPPAPATCTPAPGRKSAR